MKLAYLVNLSTTTRTISLPADLGKASTKSMLMSEKIDLGTGNGCNKPGVDTCSDLFCWQVTHVLTNSLTLFHKPFQYNMAATLWYVAWTPKCPSKPEEWNNDKIWECNTGSCPTTNFPLILNWPFSQVKLLWAVGFYCNSCMIFLIPTSLS